MSLAALRQNFGTLVKRAGSAVTVCAVVKADAYGHGALDCSRALQEEGAKWLGVTSLDEAIPLRERFTTLRHAHPLPPPTGHVADKAFFDELAGDP